MANNFNSHINLKGRLIVSDNTNNCPLDINPPWNERITPNTKRVIPDTEPTSNSPVIEKWINNRPYQPCIAEEFFKREREAGRHTSVAMISCPCPKCSPYCL